MKKLFKIICIFILLIFTATNVLALDARIDPNAIRSIDQVTLTDQADEGEIETSGEELKADPEEYAEEIRRQQDQEQYLPYDAAGEYEENKEQNWKFFSGQGGQKYEEWLGSEPGQMAWSHVQAQIVDLPNINVLIRPANLEPVLNMTLADMKYLKTGVGTTSTGVRYLAIQEGQTINMETANSGYYDLIYIDGKLKLTAPYNPDLKEKLRKDTGNLLLVAKRIIVDTQGEIDASGMGYLGLPGGPGGAGGQSSVYPVYGLTPNNAPDGPDGYPGDSGLGAVETLKIKGYLTKRFERYGGFHGGSNGFTIKQASGGSVGRTNENSGRRRGGGGGNAGVIGEHGKNAYHIVTNILKLLRRFDTILMGSGGEGGVGGGGGGAGAGGDASDWDNEGMGGAGGPGGKGADGGEGGRGGGAIKLLAIYQIVVNGSIKATGAPGKKPLMPNNGGAGDNGFDDEGICFNHGDGGIVNYIHPWRDPGPGQPGDGQDGWNSNELVNSSGGGSGSFGDGCFGAGGGGGAAGQWSGFGGGGGGGGVLLQCFYPQKKSADLDYGIYFGSGVNIDTRGSLLNAYTNYFSTDYSLSNNNAGRVSVMYSGSRKPDNLTLIGKKSLNTTTGAYTPSGAPTVYGMPGIEIITPSGGEIYGDPLSGTTQEIGSFFKSNYMKSFVPINYTIATGSAPLFANALKFYYWDSVSLSWKVIKSLWVPGDGDKGVLVEGDAYDWFPLFPAGSKTGTYYWNYNALDSNKVQIKVEVKDQNGYAGQAISKIFTVDDQQPSAATIQLTPSPARDANGWTSDAKPKLNWGFKLQGSWNGNSDPELAKFYEDFKAVASAGRMFEKSAGLDRLEITVRRQNNKSSLFEGVKINYDETIAVEPYQTGKGKNYWYSLTDYFLTHHTILEDSYGHHGWLDLAAAKWPDGTYEIALRGVDKAKNIGKEFYVCNKDKGTVRHYYYYNKDTEAPRVIEPVEVKDGVKGQGNWYAATDKVTLNLRATDEGSGVKSLEYKVDSGVWQTVSNSTSKIAELKTPIYLKEGGHKIEWKTSDWTGKTRTSSSPIEVNIDTTKPTMTVAMSGNFQTLKEITGTANDALSGVGYVELYIKDDNSSTAEYFDGDKFVAQTSPIWLVCSYNNATGKWTSDNTATTTPTTTQTTTTTSGTGLTLKPQKTYTYITPINLDKLTNGDYKLGTRVTDKAGNPYSPTVIKFSIDGSKPTAGLYYQTSPGSYEAVKAGQWGQSANLFYLQAVDDKDDIDIMYKLDKAVNWTTISKAKSKEYKQIGSTALTSGSHTITYKAVDAAKNSSAEKTISFGVDGKQPNTSITKPAVSSSGPTTPTKVSDLNVLEGTVDDLYQGKELSGIKSGTVLVSILYKPSSGDQYFDGKSFVNTTTTVPSIWLQVDSVVQDATTKKWTWTKSKGLPTVAQLQDDERYYITVKAKDDAGNEKVSDPRITKIDKSGLSAKPIGAPTVTIAVNSSTNKLELSWGAVTNATKYVIYRSEKYAYEDTTIKYSKQQEVAALKYEDDVLGATNTKNYFYYVKAANDLGGESDSKSDSVGVVKYDIKQGINWIGIPLEPQASLATASDLWDELKLTIGTNSIEKPKNGGVANIDPNYTYKRSKGGDKGTKFKIERGHVYKVSYTGAAKTWNMVGTVAKVEKPTVTLKNGINWIYKPLSQKGLVKAADLWNTSKSGLTFTTGTDYIEQPIAGTSNFNKYWVSKAGPKGTNFDLSFGQCYKLGISLSTDKQWP